jgi:AraC-like DNA-binding protein
MTGFNYPEYLSASFRRLTGQPPSQFRLEGLSQPKMKH